MGKITDFLQRQKTKLTELSRLCPAALRRLKQKNPAPGKLRLWWAAFVRQVKFQALSLLREDDSVHKLALGLAWGIFVGFLPIIPFQSIVVLTLCFLFGGNKLAAWLATFISNPINMIPFYYMLFLVGQLFTGYETTVKLTEIVTLPVVEMYHVGEHFVLTMFLGGLIMGVSGAILTYFGSYWFILRYRKRRIMRLATAAAQRATEALTKATTGTSTTSNDA